VKSGLPTGISGNRKLKGRVARRPGDWIEPLPAAGLAPGKRSAT